VRVLGTVLNDPDAEVAKYGAYFAYHHYDYDSSQEEG
jgi:hypothetical protein